MNQEDTLDRVRFDSIPVVAAAQGILARHARRYVIAKATMGEAEFLDDFDSRTDNSLAPIVLGALLKLLTRAKSAIIQERMDGSYAPYIRALHKRDQEAFAAKKEATRLALERRKPRPVVWKDGALLDHMVPELAERPASLAQFDRLRAAGAFSSPLKCWSCQSLLFGESVPTICTVCDKALTFEDWPILKPVAKPTMPPEICRHRLAGDIGTTCLICS